MTPSGNAVVVMRRTGGVTRKDNTALAVCGVGVVESLTVTFTLEVPAVDGVPEITPVVGLILSPAGKPVADQVKGDLPPDEAMVAVYAVPTAASVKAVVVMASRSTTVTVVVTSGILTPLALIVVVPKPTELTGIRIAGEVLPSQTKTPVGCTVATAGLVELRFTYTP